MSAKAFLLVINDFCNPLDVRVAELVQGIPGDGRKAVHDRPFIAGLEPVFLAGWEGDLVGRVHDQLVAHGVTVLFSGYQKTFLKRVLSRDIEIDGSGDNAHRFLFARIVGHRRVPVLGLGLIGKQDQHLDADALGLNQREHLHALSFKVVQAEIDHFDGIGLPVGNGYAGLPDHPRGPLPGRPLLGSGNHKLVSRICDVAYICGWIDFDSITFRTK